MDGETWLSQEWYELLSDGASNEQIETSGPVHLFANVDYG